MLRLRELYVVVELPQDWFELDWGDCDDGASDGYVRVYVAGLPATLQTLEVGETAQACSLIALDNTIGAVMRRLTAGCLLDLQRLRYCRWFLMSQDCGMHECSGSEPRRLQ